MSRSVRRSPEEDALLQKAMRVLPGGVLGGYYAPQELAFVVREARGPRLRDFSGREYIDYILGSGPLVLGHARPGRGDLPGGPVRRAGSLLRKRQRGHLLRAPRGPCLPSTRQDPEVRGRVSRRA